MQYDPDLLKGLLNDPDNEKFSFGEKHNDWNEKQEFAQTNEQPQEKENIDENVIVRPQIFNAEIAKTKEYCSIFFFNF